MKLSFALIWALLLFLAVSCSGCTKRSIKPGRNTRRVQTPEKQPTKVEAKKPEDLPLHGQLIRFNNLVEDEITTLLNGARTISDSFHLRNDIIRKKYYLGLLARYLQSRYHLSLAVTMYEKNQGDSSDHINYMMSAAGILIKVNFFLVQGLFWSSCPQSLRSAINGATASLGRSTMATAEIVGSTIQAINAARKELGNLKPPKNKDLYDFILRGVLIGGSLLHGCGEFLKITKVTPFDLSNGQMFCNKGIVKFSEFLESQKKTFASEPLGLLAQKLYLSRGEFARVHSHQVPEHYWFKMFYLKSRTMREVFPLLEPEIMKSLKEEEISLLKLFPVELMDRGDKIVTDEDVEEERIFMSSSDEEEEESPSSESEIVGRIEVTGDFTIDPNDMTMAILVIGQYLYDRHLRRLVSEEMLGTDFDWMSLIDRTDDMMVRCVSFYRLRNAIAHPVMNSRAFEDLETLATFFSFSNYTALTRALNKLGAVRTSESQTVGKKLAMVKGRPKWLMHPGKIEHCLAAIRLYQYFTDKVLKPTCELNGLRLTLPNYRAILECQPAAGNLDKADLGVILLRLGRLRNAFAHPKVDKRMAQRYQSMFFHDDAKLAALIANA